MLNPNVPAWFEIPTVDLDRAQRFYEAALDLPLHRERFAGIDMAILRGGDAPNSSGALVAMEGIKPSTDGSVVYIGVDDLAPVLARVAGLGGEVLVPRTALPGDMGYFATFRDSEGSRVGLFSRV